MILISVADIMSVHIESYIELQQLLKEKRLMHESTHTYTAETNLMFCVVVLAVI